MDEATNGQLNSSDVPPISVVSQRRAISGFWRRLLASIIDGLLLGLAGMVCGLFLFDQFAALGGWGRLMGFFVALTYFGVLNSAIGAGQTIGKRAMKIEVVNRAGRHISLGRSLLRYVILATPYFLNGVLIPPGVVMSPIGSVIGFIVFGFGGAILYLYVFNRRTRQSLHDLVVGSYVTRTLPPGEVVGSVWQPHMAVVGIWFLAIVALTVNPAGLRRKGSLPELDNVQSAIQAAYQVRHAGVYVGNRWRIGDRTRTATTYFGADVLWRHKPPDKEAAARLVASIILDEYPEVMDKDVLTVKVSYGYDIGIARLWKSYTSTHRPSEWQQMVSGTPSDGESMIQEPMSLNY
ncbi:MAG: RDD family protein [Planctomycetota bacterium]